MICAIIEHKCSTTKYRIQSHPSERGNAIHPDSKAVFYAILDLPAKPVFRILLILGHKDIDPSHLGLHIHDYESVHGRTNGNYPKAKKNSLNGNGVTDGSVRGNGTNGHTDITGPAAQA